MMYNYSYFSVTLRAEAFASVNVPFSAASVLLNIFFIYCMVVPQQGAEQLKDPLRVLLGSLIGCNIIIHSCSFLIVLKESILSKILPKWFKSYLMHNLTLSVMMYAMTIVASCHWRNMFYFCQIVPLQRSVFIWFKRNMRGLIYSALILNSIFSLFGVAVSAAHEIVILNVYAAYNSSHDTENMLLNSLQINSGIILVSFWIRLGVFLLSLCVMLASSCAVVLYLWRHMKNMEDSGLVSPRLQRQIKMIITGITAQALLHFLCSDGVIIFQIIIQYTELDVDWNNNILCTIIALYSFGTTINMMVGQSLFRQGAVHVWQKLLHTQI